MFVTQKCFASANENRYLLTRVAYTIVLNFSAVSANAIDFELILIIIRALVFKKELNMC